MYDPSTDSQPKLASKDPKRVVIGMATRQDPKPGAPEHVYLGDNGEVPTGAKAQFCIGHDAKLKGKLIRAHINDVEILTILDGKAQKPQTAIALAKHHGWDKEIEASKQRHIAAEQAKTERAEKAAKVKAERDAAREAAKAAKAAEREAAKAARELKAAEAKSQREEAKAKAKAEREAKAEQKREERAAKEHERAEAKAKKEEAAAAAKAAKAESAKGTKLAA